MLSRGAPAGGVGLAGAGRAAPPGGALVPPLAGRTAHLGSAGVLSPRLNPTAVCSHCNKGLWLHRVSHIGSVSFGAGILSPRLPDQAHALHSKPEPARPGFARIRDVMIKSGHNRGKGFY